MGSSMPERGKNPQRTGVEKFVDSAGKTFWQQPKSQETQGNFHPQDSGNRRCGYCGKPKKRLFWQPKDAHFSCRVCLYGAKKSIYRPDLQMRRARTMRARAFPHFIPSFPECFPQEKNPKKPYFSRPSGVYPHYPPAYY